MLPDPVAWPSDPRFQLKRGPKAALVDMLIEYALPGATFGSTAASQLKLCHDCRHSSNLSDAVKADQERDLEIAGLTERDLGAAIGRCLTVYAGHGPAEVAAIEPDTRQDLLDRQQRCCPRPPGGGQAL